MSRNKQMIIIGIIVSLLFVTIGVALLSTSEETLDKIAEEHGSQEKQRWAPPFPDYEIPGLEGKTAINIIVGLVFALLTLCITFAVGKALKAKKNAS